MSPSLELNWDLLLQQQCGTFIVISKTLPSRVNMGFFRKLFAFILIVVIINVIQTNSMPVEETGLAAGDEIMDTAESQNPFLPRFAMKRLKERREKARAERRNNHGQRRINPPPKSNCPPWRRGYYKK